MSELQRGPHPVTREHRERGVAERLAAIGAGELEPGMAGHDCKLVWE
jgi:hypothetical protein